MHATTYCIVAGAFLCPFGKSDPNILGVFSHIMYRHDPLHRSALAEWNINVEQKTTRHWISCSLSNTAIWRIDLIALVVIPHAHCECGTTLNPQKILPAPQCNVDSHFLIMLIYRSIMAVVVLHAAIIHRDACLWGMNGHTRGTNYDVMAASLSFRSSSRCGSTRLSYHKPAFQ